MEDIKIISTLDKTEQSSLFYYAGANKPLLVALHTWSFDKYNFAESILPYAKKLDWNLLLPNFRGPNKSTNPECGKNCGSIYAIQDILDTVSYVISEYKADRDSLLLLGSSGGGHMALLTAAKSPKLWKAVAAFVPITDLEKWYYENLEKKAAYADDIVACCFGKTPSEDIEEYKKRSPISFTDELSLCNLKIYHGKYDSVVPVSHSLNLYDIMQKKYPASRTFLEIFDGGHEILIDDGLSWLSNQMSGIKNTKEVTG